MAINHAPTEAIVTQLEPCPFCSKSLVIRNIANPYGRCETEGCWMADRMIGLPIEDPRQVAAWNTRTMHIEATSVAPDGLRQPNIGYHYMRAGGRCDWTQLREAVAEATTGSRLPTSSFDPAFYPGHQMIGALNYNSLDRIVTAFVDAALSATPPAPAEPTSLQDMQISAPAEATSVAPDYETRPQKCRFCEMKWEPKDSEFATPPPYGCAAIGIDKHDWVKTSVAPDGLRDALDVFTLAAYPVAPEINQRGYNWSEAYLDQALVVACAALSAAPPAPVQEVERLRQERAAWRQQAISEGWCHNLERAYGRAEYAKGRAEMLDDLIAKKISNGLFDDAALVGDAGR